MRLACTAAPVRNRPGSRWALSQWKPGMRAHRDPFSQNRLLLLSCHTSEARRRRPRRPALSARSRRSSAGLTALPCSWPLAQTRSAMCSVFILATRYARRMHLSVMSTIAPCPGTSMLDLNTCSLLDIIGPQWAHWVLSPAVCTHKFTNAPIPYLITCAATILQGVQAQTRSPEAPQRPAATFAQSVPAPQWLAQATAAQSPVGLPPPRQWPSRLQPESLPQRLQSPVRPAQPAAAAAPGQFIFLTCQPSQIFFCHVPKLPGSALYCFIS